MRHEIKKSVNKAKASMAQRRGPVQKSQERAPIADAIADFWRRDMLTFGIPAHNGGRGPAPEVAQWAGMDAVRTDLPASHGLDTRDHAWGIQEAAQSLYAEAVGAEQTL